MTESPSVWEFWPRLMLEVSDSCPMYEDYRCKAAPIYCYPIGGGREVPHACPLRAGPILVSLKVKP